MMLMYCFVMITKYLKTITSMQIQFQRILYYNNFAYADCYYIHEISLMHIYHVF